MIDTTERDDTMGLTEARSNSGRRLWHCGRRRIDMSGLVEHLAITRDFPRPPAVTNGW